MAGVGVELLLTLTAVVVVAITTVVLGVVAHRRRPQPKDALDVEVLDDSDRQELDAAFEQTRAEHAEAVHTLLLARLDTLRARMVPVRRIFRTGEPRVVRLLFADGTVLRMRGGKDGPVAPVAVAATSERIWVGSVAPVEDGVEVEFVGRYGFSHRVLAVGLDQPS